MAPFSMRRDSESPMPRVPRHTELSGENNGPAFNATILEFQSLQQDGVSLADMIVSRRWSRVHHSRQVLGAITAVGACGGPVIPFRPGRADASGPSPEGSIPQPQSSTQSHIETFARMGFSQTEMISLIACGHSIGQVHRTVNPRIVNSTTIRAFDDTRTTFDNHVAVDYIKDNRTNPMAQPWDANYPERSSDSRIFASDGNVTIARYASSSSDYMSGCSTVLAKMFDEAIPATNTLAEAIEPFAVSSTFRTTLRNGALAIQVGSSRVYNMVGQWSSFEVGYTNRDGSVATDSNLLFVRTMRTLSNGNPLQIRDFSSRSGGIPYTTG